MTFVTPSLVFGGLLIGVPILLHLIMRRKPKLLEFPALRLIQKRHDVNRRRMRLRHLLLLLLRIAAIALLALALARPSMDVGSGMGSQEAPVAVALVFDTSARMEYRHNNETRLQAAQKLVGDWLLAQLPRNSEIAVLDTQRGPGAFQVDRRAAKERVERLASVANSQPLTGVLDEALRLVGQSDLARKEVYVFTDLTRAAWPSDAPAFHDRITQTELQGAAIYVIDVGVEKPTNFALGELHLSGQVLSSRSTLAIETGLSRIGPPGRRTVELNMLVAPNQPQKAGEETFECKPDAAQQVLFHVGGLAPGTHHGYVRLMGEDNLTCDDKRFFTVEVRPPWQILVVAPKPAEHYALYLTEALAPTGLRRRGQGRFECRVIEQDALKEHSLDDYAAVCLLDPQSPDDAIWKKLYDFVGQGRGVAIFLGRNADPVDSFNTPLAQKLLPGKVLRQSRRPDGNVYLAPNDYQHPILAEFRGGGSIPWKYFPVFRFWQLDKLARGVRTVVPTSDGEPVLLERPVEGGRVLTMTTPISDDPNRKPWNLLPVGEAWPFVILANQAVSYLVGSTDQQLNYVAGQPAVLQLDPQFPHESYQVQAPDGTTFRRAPEQADRALVVSATDQIGHYRIEAGGKTGVHRGFSVNLSAEQSDLKRIDNEELTGVFGPFEYRLARTKEEIERNVSRARVGLELYPYLILAVAMVLALEHFIANRFYKK